MKNVLIVGLSQWAGELARELVSEGRAVMLIPDIDSLLRSPRHLDGRDAVVIALVELTSLDAVIAASGPLSRSFSRWVAAVPPGQRAVADAAYLGGAVAVCDTDSDTTSLVDTLRRVERTATPVAGPAARPLALRRYNVGAAIPLAQDHAFGIVKGVVAIQGLDELGNAPLLGLAGPGDILLGADADRFGLSHVAATPVDAEMRAWSHPPSESWLREGLAMRMRRMQAWAMALAEPTVERRILGILRAVAEVAGSRERDGVRIELRITHGMLASAIGATRATVTRLLGGLQLDGELRQVREPSGGQRFLLLDRSADAEPVRRER